MKQFIFIVLSITLLLGCNEDEDLNIFEVSNPYELPTGDSEFEQYQRDVFNKYNSYLLASYEDKECMWNVDLIQGIRVVQQPDANVWNKMPEVIEKLFYSSYSSEFLKKYSPFKFLLADTVHTNSIKDWPVWSGRDYILLSKVNDELFDYSDEEELQLKAKLHGCFWGLYRHKYERFVMTKGWYEVGGDNYNKKIAMLRTSKEEEDKVNPDPKKFGFWATVSDGNNDFTPDENEDVAQYVENIVLLSDEELVEAIDGWPLMKQKVNIIKQFFVDEYNIDLSAI
ncbi:MAG: putative zinc-binding metallopeptidase [Carboxylicivirga sp.]|nr:putative zinc-binding metallopeptidase [Carboxylicivirga sp.]